MSSRLRSLHATLDSARAGDARDRWARRLGHLVALPTVSSSARCRPAIDLAARELEAWLRQAGLSTRILGVPGSAPSVWAEWRRAPNRPVLLFYGHFDVQPPGPGPWPWRPFSGKIDRGRVLGRGASDNKGPLVAMLAALDACLRATGQLPVNVRVWLDPEEEVGSPNLSAFLDCHGGALKADAILLSDSTTFHPVAPTVVTALRGMVDLRVSVGGPARPLHSGVYGGEVRDPAMALARVIASLMTPDGRVAIDGFYDRVVVPSSETRRRLRAGRPPVKELARVMGVASAAGLVGEASWLPGERSTIRPSLTVTQLHGGAGGAAAIGATAAARLNFRLVPDQDPAAIACAVERHLRRHGGGAPIEVELMGSASPVVVPARHPIVQAAARALAATWGRAPIEVRSGGTIPIVAALWQRHRLPAAMWGMYRSENRIHSQGEWFGLDALHRGTEVVARVLHDVA